MGDNRISYDLFCIVCMHRLEYHLDEGGHWRCHALGPDLLQCECILRKDRAENDINYYSLGRRIKEAIERDEYPCIDSDDIVEITVKIGECEKTYYIQRNRLKEFYKKRLDELFFGCD